jgi:hypothetical protein
MRVVLDDDTPTPPVRRRAVIDDDGEPSPTPTRAREVLPLDPSDNDASATMRRARTRVSDRARENAPTLPADITRFIDPFEIRVPADVARLASRFSHEAIAGLRLELHHKSGRARTHAAQQLLALALHMPDSQTIEQFAELSNEALDAQLIGLFQGAEGEEMMAQFGFIRARTDSERAKVRAIVNRPSRRVA